MGRTRGFSGKYGTVKLTSVGEGSELEIYEILDWKFQPKSNIPKFASNRTGGWKSGVPGIRDSAGNFTIKIPKDDQGYPPLEDGDVVLLDLHVDQTGQNYIKVVAIIESGDIDVNINEGDAVGGTVSWQGIDAWQGFGIFEGMGEEADPYPSQYGPESE